MGRTGRVLARPPDSASILPRLTLRHLEPPGGILRQTSRTNPRRTAKCDSRLLHPRCLTGCHLSGFRDGPKISRGNVLTVFRFETYSIAYPLLRPFVITCNSGFRRRAGFVGLQCSKGPQSKVLAGSYDVHDQNQHQNGSNANCLYSLIIVDTITCPDMNAMNVTTAKL